MEGNLHIQVRDPDGTVVDDRLVHNVFTTVGKTWLRDLCRWGTISDPDVEVNSLRPRWVVGGTGYQVPLQNVVALTTPAQFNGSDYLQALAAPTFSPITTARYQATYTGTDFASVNLTEFGLVVDDGSLSSTSIPTEVVAYRSFLTPITKVGGQTLSLDWEIRF